MKAEYIKKTLEKKISLLVCKGAFLTDYQAGLLEAYKEVLAFYDEDHAKLESEELTEGDHNFLDDLERKMELLIIGSTHKRIPEKIIQRMENLKKRIGNYKKLSKRI